MFGWVQELVILQASVITLRIRRAPGKAQSAHPMGGREGREPGQTESHSHGKLVSPRVSASHFDVSCQCLSSFRCLSVSLSCCASTPESFPASVRCGLQKTCVSHRDQSWKRLKRSWRLSPFIGKRRSLLWEVSWESKIKLRHLNKVICEKMIVLRWFICMYVQDM